MELQKGKLRIYGDKSIPGIETTSGSLAQAPGICEWVRIL